MNYCVRAAPPSGYKLCSKEMHSLLFHFVHFKFSTFIFNAGVKDKRKGEIKVAQIQSNDLSVVFFIIIIFKYLLFEFELYLLK